MTIFAAVNYLFHANESPRSGLMAKYPVACLAECNAGEDAVVLSHEVIALVPL